MRSLKNTLAPWGAATNPQYAQTVGGILSGAMAAPVGFAQAAGDAYRTYGQGFGAYGQSLANLANSEASLRGNQYAAYGSAEQARQNATGQLGVAALAGFGNAANAAQQAWAANQTGYMKALSDMMGANQYATSQYGQGRETALAKLGSDYSSAGTGFANSRAALANAYGSLAGQGAQAYGSLAGQLGNAGAAIGSSANQSLGGLRGNAVGAMGALGSAGANAIGGIGSSANNAFGAFGGAAQNAMGQLGGSGAMASGNVGSAASNAYGQIGSAFGSAAGGVNQAALQGMAGIGAAGQNTLGTLGAAGANMAGQFGNAAANVAQTATNYTRDMAKLGLARELGLGGMNVSSQGLATGPWTAGAIGGGGGGGFGGGGISLSGPGGEIASGGYGPNYFGAGSGAAGSAVGGGVGGGAPQPIYVNPYDNLPFYQDGPQMYDGGGMAALGALGSQGFGMLTNMGAGSMQSAADGMGMLQGSARNATGRLASMNRMNNAAVRGTAGDSQRDLRSTSQLGYDSMLGGLARSGRDVASLSRNAANAVSGAVDRGYSSIASQANSGADDIARATRDSYGFLQGAGDRGFGGIGAALAGGMGGIRSESDAIGGTERNTFGELGSLRDSIVSSPILGALNSNFANSLSTLGSAYGASRNDPQAMMNSALAGLAGLNSMNLNASQAGMDQFYGTVANTPSVPFERYRRDINSGWGGMGSQLQSTQRQVRDLYDNSIGRMGIFSGSGSGRDGMLRQLEQDLFSQRRRGFKNSDHLIDLYADLGGDLPSLPRRSTSPNLQTPYRTNA